MAGNALFAHPTMNIEEVYFRNQDNIDMKRLRATMDTMFEYYGQELIDKGFGGMVLDMLRNKQCRLKRKKTLCPKKKPLNIQDGHWNALEKY